MPNSGGSTTTQTSKPWEGQQPYIEEGYKGAQTLYNKGPAQYFPGSTVAGFTPESGSALNAIYSQGMNGQQQRAGSQNALDMFSGGGAGDWDAIKQLQNMGGQNFYKGDPAYSTLAGVQGAGGANLAANLYGRTSDIIGNGGNVGGYTAGKLDNIANTGGNVGGYSLGAVGDLTGTGGNNLAQYRTDVGDIITGQAQAMNPANQNLMATANGNYLNSNPYLDDTYNKAAQGVTRQFAEGVAPGIDSAASSAGRYGSGMHANVKDAAGQKFGQTLGDLATSIYGGNYAQERQNQLSAANTLGSQYLQGQGLRASAAGTSAGQGTSDAQTRLAATGLISGNMSGDLGRQMQATGQISGDMSGDLARRMQASGAMTGAEQGDYSNLMGSLGMQSDMYNTGANRQLQTLDQANNLNLATRAQQLQGLGMQPAYQNMNYTDLNAASAAGAQRDQMSQQQLNDQIARFDFGQNADWQNLQRYLASIQGGSPGATTSITQSGSGLGGLASLFAGAGGLGQLAMGTKGLLW